MAQVGRAIPRCAPEQEMWHAERIRIEFLVYGVACPRVIQLETKKFGRW
jgi:hypothetical protein